MDLPAPSLNSSKGIAGLLVAVLVALFVLSQFDMTRRIAGIGKGQLSMPGAGGGAK